MSRILLLGASGFIGSELARALLADGHAIRAAGRDLDYGKQILNEAEWAHCDLRAMLQQGDWAELLDGCDIVINASGALQSGLRDNVDDVQDRAIRALIDACADAGVSRSVQISAAGADEQPSDFMQSKARADAALAASGLACTIIRPGLVIGRNGFGGTELLRAAAGAPFVAIEVGGTGSIQCIALSDLVAAVRLAVEGEVTGRFDLVETQPRSLGEIIALHRKWLGLPAPRFSLRLPLWALWPLTLAADLLGWLGWRSPLRSNSIAALTFGVKGDPEEARALLGREPLSLPDTLRQVGGAGKADRWHARLASVYPLALAALVILWLAGGIIGLSRIDAGTAMLVRGGLGETAARLVVIGGALADIAIGLGILYRPTLKLALGSGAALALAYVLGAAIVRPDLWLDPLGPMVKVLPAIALSLSCLAMAEER